MILQPGKLSELLAISKKPNLYEKGTSFMWTDPHISKQLLQAHLDPDTDLASRKRSTIEKTAKWILESQKVRDRISIMDLGCGPGLYTEAFARRGHTVTGIDVSDNSIAFAVESANENGLQITYKNVNYLDTDLGSEKYDIIILIYTDLGVLLPLERKKLLTGIYKALKSGGVFIFDVLNDHNSGDKLSPKTWEVCHAGFWKDSPYLALSESFLYEEEKVILFQHTILSDDESMEIYRFWTHLFSQDDVTGMLEPCGFRNISFYKDVVPQSDTWNGEHVTFVKCEK